MKIKPFQGEILKETDEWKHAPGQMMSSTTEQTEEDVAGGEPARPSNKQRD